MKLDERRKSTKLFRVGQEAAEHFNGCCEAAGVEPLELDRQLYAVACMLDEALNGAKRAKSKAKKEEGPLPFDGPAVHRRFVDELPEAFFYQPVDNRWWANLNKQIRDLDLKPENLDQLVQWFKGGRGAGFKQLPFSVMVKNFKAWITEAAAGDAGIAGQSNAGFRMVKPRSDDNE